MIKYNYEVSVNENRAKLNKDIFLFRGNRNIHYYFSIKGARFAFEKEGDLIENANAIYAAVTVIKPNGVEVANAIAPVENGLIHLKVTEDLIDEEVEIGDFDLVFDLFDDSDGAVTIPKIKGQFHVQERPCTTSIGTLSGNVNVVNQAVVDLAIATQENEQLIVVDDDGKYVKTTWAKGDKISVERLNKMEEGIYNNSSRLKNIGTGGSTNASDITITDVNDNFESANVEGALNELGTQYKDIAKKIESGNISSNLKNLTWNVLGDSITNGAGSTPYCKIISDRTGVTINNYGIISSTIGNYTDGTYTFKPMCVRYAEMVDDVDIITVMGGTNDGSSHISANEDYYNYDQNTFVGSFNILLQGLINKYPNKIIAVISPPNNRQTNNSYKNMRLVSKTMKECCENLSVPFLDLNAEIGISELDVHMKEYMKSDYVHPNNIGQEKMANLIQPFLEELVSKKVDVTKVTNSSNITTINFVDENGIEIQDKFKIDLNLTTKIKTNIIHTGCIDTKHRIKIENNENIVDYKIDYDITNNISTISLTGKKSGKGSITVQAISDGTKQKTISFVVGDYNPTPSKDDYVSGKSVLFNCSNLDKSATSITNEITNTKDIAIIGSGHTIENDGIVLNGSEMDYLGMDNLILSDDLNGTYPGGGSFSIQLVCSISKFANNLKTLFLAYKDSTLVIDNLWGGPTPTINGETKYTLYSSINSPTNGDLVGTTIGKAYHIPTDTDSYIFEKDEKIVFSFIFEKNTNTKGKINIYINKILYMSSGIDPNGTVTGNLETPTTVNLKIGYGMNGKIFAGAIYPNKVLSANEISKNVDVFLNN